MKTTLKTKTNEMTCVEMWTGSSHAAHDTLPALGGLGEGEPAPPPRES